MRVIAYLRVSTDDQVASGLGLADQDRAIRGWCVAMGYELVAVYRDEAASARTTKRRPGLDRAVAHVMSDEADALVTLKLDRLTRSVADFCEFVSRFKAAGKHIMAVRESVDTSTAIGSLFAQILVVFAEYESALIGERTRAALEEARRRGTQLGGKRKVYDEALVAQVIHAVDHTMSLRAAAAWLSSVRQERWDVKKIQRVLRDP